MNKKLFCILLTATLALIFFPMSVSRVSAETEGDYEYSINDGKTRINEYTGSAEDVVVPDTLGGYPVTEIGRDAFRSCDSLSSVVMPDSVTMIGNTAFFSCANLTAITIGNNVNSIGNQAFSYCGITSINIPASVLELGSNLFSGSASLTAINVAGNNTVYSSIDGVLLNKNQTKLMSYPEGRPDKTYLMPDSIMNIDGSAFGDCNLLQSVTIGKNVIEINDYAFNGCKYLESINVAENNTMYSGLDGVLFDKRKTELVRYPEGRPDKTYNIPSSVINIKANLAFTSCSLLESVIIPSSVSLIGNDSSSENIPARIFSGCTSLKNITVSENNSKYSSIDGVLFDKNRTTLLAYPTGKTNPSYSIPNGVKLIGSYAFGTNDSWFIARNEHLKSVFIPDSITCLKHDIYASNPLTCGNCNNDNVNIGPFDNSDVIIYCRKDSLAHKYAVTKNLEYSFDVPPELVTTLPSATPSASPTNKPSNKLSAKPRHSVPDKKALAKPTGLKLTTKKASWKLFKNNSGYTLKLMQGKKKIKTVQIKKNKNSWKIPKQIQKRLKKSKKKCYFTLVAKGKGNFKNSKIAKSKNARL